MRLAAVLVAAVALAGCIVLHGPPRDDTPEENRHLGAPPTGGPLRPLTSALAVRAGDGAPRYVTGIAPGGRYFVDQDGAPILVRGDAPWPILADLRPGEARRYFATRSAQGFNAALVSLIGTTQNGGPSDDGATTDGLRPFADGDVLRWNQPYFARAHEILAEAASLGITVLLYPIDSWTLERQFSGVSPSTCRHYGEQVARWAADLPNVLWMSGGDYVRSDMPDACTSAVLAGIRSTGDVRPFSMQMWKAGSAAGDDLWRDRVDWDFVYTYGPTPLAIAAAYDAGPVRPVLLGEANYEGMNLSGGPDTTTETLRRQTLWALTSGAAGDVCGTADWQFPDGWSGRLWSPGAIQVARIRDYVASLPWWTLEPGGGLLRESPGQASAHQDVLDADLVTAARSRDGTLGLVYVPSPRTLRLDVARLAPGSAAAWVDPSTGVPTPVALAPELATPGRNADGGEDWLLVLGTVAGNAEQLGAEQLGAEQLGAEQLGASGR